MAAVTICGDLGVPKNSLSLSLFSQTPTLVHSTFWKCRWVQFPHCYFVCFSIILCEVTTHIPLKPHLLPLSLWCTLTSPLLPGLCSAPPNDATTKHHLFSPRSLRTVNHHCLQSALLSFLCSLLTYIFLTHQFSWNTPFIISLSKDLNCFYSSNENRNSCASSLE